MSFREFFKRSNVPGKVPSVADLALGEIAINTYDGKMYTKKSVSGVESIVQISGSGGGGSGSVWYSGAGVPSAGIGVAGDYYLDTNNGDVYSKGGSWTLIDNLTGPTGAAGSPGVGVPTGGTAGQVLAKVNGTNYNTTWVDQATELPTQTGNSGKFLTTNGTSPSWATVTSGVTDHGALTGLTDDDHTQYALADGTRGNFAATGHNHSGVYQPVGSYLTTTGDGSGLTGLTKTQVGLGNVDNTTDLNKPISTATQTALNGKADTGHNHTGTYQPIDNDLTAIAGLAGTSGFLKKTATDTWALDTTTYAASGHNHTIDSLSNVSITGLTSGHVLKWNGSAWANAVDATAGGATWGSITGTLSTQTDLQTALNGKANTATTLAGYGITDAASSTHSHGNITNAGAIGSTANLPIITTTGGALTVGSFGSAANTFCQGNDSRLSDARTPTSHDITSHTASGLTTGHFLKATSATTYTFGAHGLTAADVSAVPTTRTVSTTSPLSGGGALSGNLTLSLASGYGDTQNPYASKTANFVLAAPNGAAGVPTFRAIVAADIPTLNQNTTGSAASLSANLPVSNLNSGTGATASTFWCGDGTWKATSAGGATWGSITGTLSSQTDLQTALNGKANTATTLAGYGITDAALSTHNHTIDSLSNVTITSKATNDLLQWNGTAWVNKTIAGAGLQPAGSYQAADADLTAIAALTGTSGFLKTNGAGTWSVDTNTYLTSFTDTNVTLTNSVANATFYIPFASTATGNQALSSNTALSFNPSTGVLSATTFSGAHSGSGANLTSIPNAALTNSSVTIGSTAVSLGATSTTLAGLTSVTSTGFTGALTGNASTATNVAASGITGTTLASNVVTSSLTTVGTVTTGTWSGSFGAVSGANLTSLTAGNLSGTIPSAVLGNSTVNIGTTAIALNRASGAIALTGITSIDGSAASATTATNATNTAITNDAATAVAVYPTWVTANTGNLPQKTTSAALSFIPSTGVLSATGFSGSGASLTALNASNLSTGTVNTARLGSGTADGTTYLRGDGTWATPAGGGSGTPGGTNTAIQFNNAGAFGGDGTNFTYDSATHAMYISGPITGNGTLDVNTFAVDQPAYFAHNRGATTYAPGTLNTWESVRIMNDSTTVNAASGFSYLVGGEIVSGFAGVRTGTDTGYMEALSANAGAWVVSARFDSTGIKISTAGKGLTLNASTTAVATPAAGNVTLFGKNLANRILPASVGPSGMDAALQPAVWRQKVARWNPPGNSTTVPGVDGFVAPTAVGTATARNVATTNLMTRTRRLGYVSAATAGSLTGHYGTTAQFTTGNGSGLGGFFYSCRFAFSDAAAVSGVRSFVGMTSSVAAFTNVEPNTLTNAIGVAQLSTDTTQLYFVYGGSAAQTAIALGTNFAPYNGTVGVTTGNLFDLTLFCPPSSNGVVHVMLENVSNGQIYTNTITPGTPGTQTPANTTLLAHRAWRTNNATALAVGIDIIGIYIETDY